MAIKEDQLEILKSTPYRKNVPTILVTDRIKVKDDGEKLVELYSLDVTSPEQTAKELNDLLGQVMESSSVECVVNNRVKLPNGQIINNVHDESSCADRPCSIHHPSVHHMAGSSQRYDYDKVMMMRVCMHGVPHPDPDDKMMYRLSVSDEFADIEHQCCSGWCCQAPRISRKKLAAKENREQEGQE